MATIQTFTAGQVLTAAQLSTLQSYVGVVQVQSTFKSDAFTTTSTSFVDVTGASVSITPTSASNKVLILVATVVGQTDSSNPPRVNLLRGATNISQSTTGTTGNQSNAIYTGSTSAGSGMAIVFLDSPATTSATTYKLQLAATAGTATIGRFASNNTFPSVTTITVMEVTP